MINELTQERLKELLHYDPDSGNFIRKVKTNPNQTLGTIAGTPDGGYIRIMVDKRSYLAHRLVWFYMTGYWPEKQIDHIDRNRANNRFENLREADNALNQQNASKRRDNTTGHTGVYWCKRDKKWIATISYFKQRKCLGYFDDFETAVEAYKEAKATYHVSP